MRVRLTIWLQCMMMPLLVGGAGFACILHGKADESPSTETVVLLSDDFESGEVGQAISTSSIAWQGNDGSPVQAQVVDAESSQEHDAEQAVRRGRALLQRPLHAVDPGEPLGEHAAFLQFGVDALAIQGHPAKERAPGPARR